RQNAAGPRTAFRNYHVDQDSTSHGVVNQTRWDILDNLTFKNIFGLNWGTARGPGSGNYDGIDAPLFDSRGVLSPGSTYPNGDWGKLGGWSSRDWSEEAQLLGTLFDGRVDWQGGFYYRISASRDYETGTGNVIFGSLSGFPAPASFCTDAGVPSPCTRARRGHSKTYAVYGQATFAVTDDINLTGGFRHTWDTTTSFETAAETQFITFNGFPQAVSFAGTPTIPGANELSTVTPLAQANTYTVTADWRVTDAVLLYLAHRTGYTRGGINSTAPIDSPKRTFQPERIKDIELGVKADWSLGDVTARTNIALYRNWYSDVQRSDVIPGTGFSILDNAGDSIIQGVEFENAITFSEWFDVRANLSFIDAHFTNWLENSTCAAQRYRPGCETLSAANATATQLLIDHANGVITAVVSPAPFTPLFFEPDRFRGAAKWTASIQPTVHLTPWLGEDISIGANVYYRSSYAAFTISGAYFAGLTPDPRPGVFGSGNPFISDPYTLVDLQADWRNIGDSRVSIGARVTNLMNTVYSLSGALGHITTSGVGAGYAGEPRMWFMDVRVDF
ncbi:MAG: TonB-dependent receptor, partial [Amphiplicatus sp.]